MKHTIKYQITVQWDSRNDRYEAYSPTLSTFANTFLPDFPKTAHGKSMSAAVASASKQATELLRQIKHLNILPPPPDVGSTDPVEYFSTEGLPEELVL